jgi:hypothetical protein
MANPYRGEIPADPKAGFPRGAAQIRAHWRRLTELAFSEALRRDPTLRQRYDERALRVFYRDYERHFEQLARAVSSGSDETVQQYAEWLTPLMRRRRVPMGDLVTFIAAMAPASRTVLTTAEDEAAQGIVDRWIKRQYKAKKLPGDRKRNPVLSFFWKGVGIAD